MKQSTLNKIEQITEITLCEREQRLLSAHTPKQVEVYLMKKFISEYRFINSCNKGGGSQTDCWRRLNAFLESKGYKPKKHLASVNKLWDVPFVSLELEYYGDYWA
ncbi:hypothetical protein LIT25_23900 [Bacillus sp. F19]|nr:hypothetical protein LIT25_23900 [Bacillus sp. F19]